MPDSMLEYMLPGYKFPSAGTCSAPGSAPDISCANKESTPEFSRGGDSSGEIRLHHSRWTEAVPNKRKRNAPQALETGGIPQFSYCCPVRGVQRGGLWTSDKCTSEKTRGVHAQWGRKSTWSRSCLPVPPRQEMNQWVWGMEGSAFNPKVLTLVATCELSLVRKCNFGHFFDFLAQ